MSLDGYGRIFTPAMLEDDVERLLAPAELVADGVDFLTPLLREVERQNTWLTAGDLVAPESWNTVSAVDDWPTDRLPAVVTINGGSDADPERDEDGIYHELWVLHVMIVVSASKLRDATRLAGAYAAALRAAVTQNLASYSDNVAGVLAGRIDPRPLPLRDPTRVDTVAAGLVAFRVVVPNVLTDIVSVMAPPEDPDVPAPDDPLVDVGAVEISTIRIS